MKKVIFKGCGTAIITPFDDSGVNFKEFERLVKFQINNGADALIVCGTTGESSTMTKQEKIDTMKCAIRVANKKIPIIAGIGSNNTAAVLDMIEETKEIGLDGYLIVTPYYNKTTQEGLIEHYTIIANKSPLPIILYNVPSRTGVNISPETCLKLSKINNIVAIKEASGNISQVAEIASLCQNELMIYSGNDDQAIPIMSLGGIGVISVLSNIEPKYTHDMVSSYLGGNIQKASAMQIQAIPMIKALFSEVNPIPIKAALNIRGFNAGIPRHPLVEASDTTKQILQNLHI